tara:strand:+ start:340 stop:507 length:168 start_codon:yes stop_codon:yes gene_type:complete
MSSLYFFSGTLVGIYLAQHYDLPKIDNVVKTLINQLEKIEKDNRKEDRKEDRKDN